MHSRGILQVEVSAVAVLQNN